MMVNKDYYKILEVGQGASPAEIKKSYRRLALQYHPDKNFGNQLYTAKFREIQEAYKTLIDVNKRSAYNATRYQQAHEEKRKTATQITPQAILLQAIDFRKKISVLDPDRMNKLALFQQIQHLLSVQNINLLKRNGDTHINKRVIEEILYCSRYLPFAHVEKICFQLTALAGTDNRLYRKIFNFSKEIKRHYTWEKYKVLAALLVGIFLSLIVYFLSTSF